MRSNTSSTSASSAASLAALVSAGSLAALLTPSNSNNIKGLSLNLTSTASTSSTALPMSMPPPTASATNAPMTRSQTLAPTPPASVSPTSSNSSSGSSASVYHPYQMAGGMAGNTRQAPSCASTLDNRPTKRRRPSAGAVAVAIATPTPISVQPTAPFTLISAASMPLTPNTPTSQFHFGSCASASGAASGSSFGAPLPAAPLTPVSPVDLIQHQLHHLQQRVDVVGNAAGATAASIPPIAVAAYSFAPRSSTSSCSSASASSSASPSFLSASSSYPTSCRNATFPHCGSAQHFARPAFPPLNSHLAHAAELARRQVILAPQQSGIFLVAEHRGLIKESSAHVLQLQSVAGASPIGPRGDGILAVVPNDGLELMFRTEARLPICDHFLYHRTNMSGGTTVANARKHTIAWLIELNAQHQLFRYKTNTMCVAVQYLDRFLDCLAREGAALAVGAPLAAPTIVGPRNACGPHFSAQKPAALAQWRSYDWYVAAVVCLSLAAKMVEEYDDPTMRDMVGLDFHAEHIRQTQLAVCKALGFDLGAASPVNFLVEYAALPPVRDLVAELLPQNPHRQPASGSHSPMPGHEANHGLATPPLSPPTSSHGSPGHASYSSAPSSASTNPAEPRTCLDKIPSQAPSADLEQFQSMVAPAILNRVQDTAEQYLIAVLPHPESASFTASELAMASLNLALEIRSLKAHAVARIHPVTGAQHVDYLPKSLALGFYGSSMTERTHRARDLMLAILPRERFFAPPSSHPAAQYQLYHHDMYGHYQQQAHATSPPVVASQ